MINANINNASASRLKAQIELFNSSTLLATCTCADNLKEFVVERLGENGKFFGFGVCHKSTIQLIDLYRDLPIEGADTIKISYVDDDGALVYPYPDLRVTEVNRDEKNNTISTTVFDALERAAAHTVEELALESFTLEEFAQAAAALLGCVGAEFSGVPATILQEVYEEGAANFEGTEKLRAALDAVAEATQTIYYINNENKLIFKRLDASGAAVESITKSKYFELTTGEAKVLAAICSATELGNNITASTGAAGVTQYVRENPFYMLRADTELAEILENAVAAVGGLSIAPFSCDWLGNVLLEIGDKIELTAENDSLIYSYLLNDSITYDGTLTQISAWEYTESSAESYDNPTSLGEALNQTFARVDKVNKRIELVTGQTENNTTSIATLEVNTKGINASVIDIQKAVKANQENTEGELDTIRKEVSAKMSAEDVTIAITTELDNGVDKVTTSTGFTFDDTGLNISKSDSEISTNISEDGMSVSRSGAEVLRADNTGVKAENLHATTYLIIGTNSRFEDYDGNRTGCFWIG